VDHQALRRGHTRAVSRVALLPLDDRPVNYDHPWWTGRAAGIEVLRPPREWLGNPFRAAARDSLAEWLSDEGRSADALVVAIDTLAYGGLIPSRQGSEPLEEVRRRLEPLRSVRRARPDLPILAASILMRVNRSNSAEEEKPYGATYGRDLFRLSYLDDKAAVGEATDAERSELHALSTSVPADVVADYRSGRARNHAINRLVLEWVGEGIFEYAVIAQDDTAPYGWNIAEARTLRELIRRSGLADRASVYPGADEIGSLLVAAAACRDAGFAPSVWPRYSGVDGRSAVTAYEDRPFEELLKAHLGPLGGRLAASPDEADLIVAVNAPGEAQAEAWLQGAVRSEAGQSAGESVDRPELVPYRDALPAVRREMASVRRNVDELARSIAADLARGRAVAVVDVAFANGADVALCERLLATVPVAQLASFGAWNTAGNSLGSAIAQATVRSLARRERVASHDALAAHVGLLFIHLLDDYAYQSVVRTELMFEDLPGLGIATSFERLPDKFTGEVESRLARRLGPHVESLARALSSYPVDADGNARHVSSITIDPPRLPWKRLFEVAIEPHVEIR
jgi:uncharacterized protein DUF4127